MTGRFAYSPNTRSLASPDATTSPNPSEAAAQTVVFPQAAAQGPQRQSSPLVRFPIRQSMDSEILTLCDVVSKARPLRSAFARWRALRAPASVGGVSRMANSSKAIFRWRRNFNAFRQVSHFEYVCFQHGERCASSARRAMLCSRLLGSVPQRQDACAFPIVIERMKNSYLFDAAGHGQAFQVAGIRLCEKGRFRVAGRDGLVSK